MSWRCDLFVVGPEPDVAMKKPDVEEPSEDAILRSLDDAERMLQTQFVAQSFITAWAALESAMRHRLRAEGSEAGWGTSPRTMLNELVSCGVLSNVEFRELEHLFQLRSVIVHGFAAPIVDPSDVQLLVDTARRLLDESHVAKQSA
ncbi:MAG: hypothetical protein B7Z73_08225 [Planctomycetia bacterium 21-64-5]|nr:MAG: hypothetical protein B7Z73_08225 [Planctomycetia bacterium 21-64-5]